MERIVKGIWIPIEIWQDERLTWNEKILLMEIDSYTNQDKECYISNEYIMTLLSVSDRTASRCMKTLLDLGLVEVARCDGRLRYVRSKVAKNGGAESPRMSGQSRQNWRHTNNNDLNISCSLKRTREKIDFDFAGALRAAGVADQHVKEWMVIRADKKATNTETAFKGFLREAEAAGFTPDEAVTRCIEETWKGFRACYVQERFPRQGGAPRQPQQKESLVEHNAKAMQEMINILANK